MSRDEERELLVPDGTPLKVAVSALIKTLRRGQEVEALYWARQIEARYAKYVWRRLRIFASEDVGLADPQALSWSHRSQRRIGCCTPNGRTSGSRWTALL